MGKQIFFYGSENDIKNLIESIDLEKKFDYHLTGLLEKEEMIKYESLLDNPEIGVAKSGSNLFCDKYLVCMLGQRLQVREIPQSKGGAKYAIDQLKNPDSITFSPAGILKLENAIIEGSVGSSTDTEKSKEIFTFFLRHIKKLFSKHNGVYIGPDAMKLLKNDWRFASNLNSPREYDLKR